LIQIVRNVTALFSNIAEYSLNIIRA